MVNIIFIGAPGSGKGTQSELLGDNLKIPNISTGDILRREVQQKSDIGILAKSYMNSGSLVPDDVMIGIIKRRISENDCDNGFILDGFPRNYEQNEILKTMLIDLGKKIDLVINIDVDDGVLIKRIAGRFSCAKCNSVYNRFFNQTKLKDVCDKCGGVEFNSRSDDNEETVKNRLKVYNQNTEKLISIYKEKSLFFSVDGLKGIALINSEINEAVDKVILGISN